MELEIIYTSVDGSIEYRTKKRSAKPGQTKYSMKRSNSESWSDSYKEKKVISAFDSGNDVKIKFKANNKDVELIFDYSEVFELYTFLDLFHQQDVNFESDDVIHFTKS